MWRIMLGAFVVAHGLVTGVIWAVPLPADAPFNPGHSWLVGETRRLSMIVGLVAASGMILAGIGFLGHGAWWALFGAAGAGLSLVLMVVFFSPWLVAGVAISAGVLYASVQSLQGL
jgi:hypothetical protein